MNFLRNFGTFVVPFIVYLRKSDLVVNKALKKIVTAVGNKKNLEISKIAVIDCGTNTFKLLIAKIVKERWFAMYQSTLSVKLSENSLPTGIHPDRMARGMDVLKAFRENIINFEAEKTFAYATSAIRSANNGREYVQMVKEQTSIDIQVIDGDREAELIFKGVRQSLELTPEPILIMDIGGGSTEFVIANDKGILWKQSFQLGSSRLNNMFQPSSPMTTSDQAILIEHFEKTLQPLFAQVKIHQPKILLGNSGSFNSLVSMINSNFEGLSLEDRNNEIPLLVFDEIHRQLCAKTLEEKLLVRGLVPMRAEIITLATILIRFVLDKTGIEKLTQTPFSLKEGVIGEFMEQ